VKVTLWLEPTWGMVLEVVQAKVPGTLAVPAVAHEEELSG
jgi:hypothetical protein